MSAIGKKQFVPQGYIVACVSSGGRTIELVTKGWLRQRRLRLSAMMAASLFGTAQDTLEDLGRRITPQRNAEKGCNNMHSQRMRVIRDLRLSFLHAIPLPSRRRCWICSTRSSRGGVVKVRDDEVLDRVGSDAIQRKMIVAVVDVSRSFLHRRCIVMVMWRSRVASVQDFLERERDRRLLSITLTRSLMV